MGKKAVFHELILLYADGLKQADVIRLGYRPKTAYNYYHKFVAARQKKLELTRYFVELMQKERLATEKKELKIKEPDKRLKNPFMSEIKVEEIKKKVKNE